jgi:hypothetical protein
VESLYESVVKVEQLADEEIRPREVKRMNEIN